MTRPDRIAAGTMWAAALITALMAALGWSPWPVFAATVAAGVYVFGARWGYLFSAALSLSIVFAATLASLLVSAQLHTGILATLAVTLGLLILVFSMVRLVRGIAWPRASRASWHDLAGSALGPAVWLVSIAISARLPDAERLSWGMRGDSLNNLVLSHVILRDFGIVLGPNANPVPLSAALIATGILPGRPSGGTGPALAHDLVGMETTWAGLIALSSILAGLVVASIVRTTTQSTMAIGLAAAGGSLLVLSWYVTGYPIEFGFFNLAVALPMLLISFLLAFLAERRPWVAVVGLALTSTLTLATWSPLVLVPLALLLVTAIRLRAVVWPRRRIARAVVGIAGVQLVLYALFGALPSFVAQSSALAANGGIYDQNAVVVFAAGVVVLGVVVALHWRNRKHWIIPGVIVLASWTALGILLVINRRNAVVWTYYPIKLAYFSTVIFIVVGFGFAAAFVARHSSRRLLRWLAIALLGVIVIGVDIVAPHSAAHSEHLSPVARITSSHPHETAAEDASLILAIAHTGTSAVVWGSQFRDEPQVDRWLIQLRDDELSPTSPLRQAAYAQAEGSHSIQELCAIARMEGSSIRVYTPSGPAVLAQLHRSCADVSVTALPLPTF